MNGYSRGFFGTPTVVKNIIYINVIMFLASLAADQVYHIDLTRVLGMYFVKSDQFHPYQLLTHMFMHGSITHILFNMLGLFFLGQFLEQVWGPKRFLVYYLITGIGAILINESVLAIQYYRVMSHISPDVVQEVLDNGLKYTLDHKAYVDPLAGELQSLLYTPTVGASGAIFGVLLAIGVLFPNMQLMIFPLPIPIKAKFFVAGYAAVELFLAVSQPGSSIAHAAHLGGMIFGYILIRYWRKTTKTLY